MVSWRDEGKEEKKKCFWGNDIKNTDFHQQVFQLKLLHLKLLAKANIT